MSTSGTTNAPDPAQASTTTSGPVTTPVFKPTKPIMGDHEQVSHDKFVPYTGGIPNETWTDLKTKPVHVLPTMHRSQSAKDPHYRTTIPKGTKKFSREGDLIKFQRDTMRHFQTYGMDTITYIPFDDGNNTNPEPSNPSNPDPAPNVPTPAPITPPSKPEPPPIPIRTI